MYCISYVGRSAYKLLGKYCNIYLEIILTQFYKTLIICYINSIQRTTFKQSERNCKLKGGTTIS